MQPYFFPYIGYFQLISAVNKFVIYDDVNYIKQGWINRNRILLAGKPFLVSIPIKNRSSFQKINQSQISYNRNWQVKLIKTLTSAYKKAPFFETTLALVDSVIAPQPETISSLAMSSIVQVSAFLRIPMSIVRSSTVYENAHLPGQARIIDICLHEKARIYVNSDGGKNLYSKEAFKAFELDLKYLKPQLVAYDQHIPHFVPGLSIIDVLMFNSPEQVRMMLEACSLE